MVVTYPSKLSKSQQLPRGEQRVVFNHMSWQDYLSVLNAIGEDRSARLTYDEGRLEITMPLQAHEFASEMIALFIRILVEELGLQLKSMGSTTLSYPQMDKGAEPDKGFYIQNYNLVAGREVDLAKDPPPDLVVEIDITHTDINKLSLYAAMGILEFWRFDGELIRFYLLRENVYEENERSQTFPQVDKTQLYDFLSQSEHSEVQASRTLRQWIRQTT